MNGLRELPRLTELRERVGLSVDELAERAGVLEKTIVTLESGSGGRAQPGTARKIAEALGVRVDLLYGDTENLGPQPFTASYEHDEEGWYLASCAEIPGVTVRGRKFEEARNKLREATWQTLKDRRHEMFQRLQGHPDASWEPFGVDDE